MQQLTKLHVSTPWGHLQACMIPYFIIYFILMQGHMFRLEVSNLQGLKTFFVTRCFAHFGIP